MEYFRFLTAGACFKDLVLRNLLKSLDAFIFLHLNSTKLNLNSLHVTNLSIAQYELGFFAIIAYLLRGKCSTQTITFIFD